MAWVGPIWGGLTMYQATEDAPNPAQAHQMTGNPNEIYQVRTPDGLWVFKGNKVRQFIDCSFWVVCSSLEISQRNSKMNKIGCICKFYWWNRVEKKGELIVFPYQRPGEERDWWYTKLDTCSQNLFQTPVKQCSTHLTIDWISIEMSRNLAIPTNFNQNTAKTQMGSTDLPNGVLEWVFNVV